MLAVGQRGCCHMKGGAHGVSGLDTTFEISPQTLIPKQEAALFLEFGKTKQANVWWPSCSLYWLTAHPPRSKVNDGYLQLKELTGLIPYPTLPCKGISLPFLCSLLLLTSILSASDQNTTSPSQQEPAAINMKTLARHYCAT